MRALLRILSFTKDLAPYYIGIVVTATLLSVANLIVPFIIGWATDTVVEGARGTLESEAAIRRVIIYALMILLAQISAMALKSIGGYWGDMMSMKMKTLLSTRYYEKLLRLPQRYFDGELTGKIVSRLNRSITEVTNFAAVFSNMFFTTLVTTLAIVIIAGIYAWPLALLLLIVFPVYMWLTALTSKRWQVYEGKKNENIDIAGGRFAEVVSQIKVVKSFNQEKREYDIFSSKYEKAVGHTVKQSRWWHSMDALRLAVLALIMAAMYTIIFTYTVWGRFSVGDMVILIQLVTMAAQPVNTMSYLVDSAQRAIVGSEDYFDVMELEEAPIPTRSPRADQRRLTRGHDAVSFEDVSFSYEEDNPVLNGLSFLIPTGSKVALVGESGGGKTTIINLLLGLYRQDSGIIRIGGADTRDMSPVDLRETSGVVFQEPNLFSGTIAENISYANPEASEEQIEEAARLANAHQFISRFSGGYDTVIGERGLKLSGGQKQRISIARAILKDPELLILDEATSALDTKSERLVQGGLDKLMAGRTSLIIAHRLSTIATVDTIVTLKDGAVHEIGSPADLATSGGIYAQLLALQDEGTKAARKLMKGYGIDR